MGVQRTVILALLCLFTAGGVLAGAANGGSAYYFQAQSAAEPIDINRASVDELMQLPGVTRVWAERIVRFRPYRAKNQLVTGGIVPPRVYQLMKDRVVAHRAAK